MAVIKYDVSGVDPEQSIAGTGEAPKPGVYTAVVKECNPGFSKGDDGKPDQSRPRVEVVYSLTNDANRGFPLWQYLTFTEASLWKLDQFLQAMGIADAKKRKGQFKSEEVIGKPCRVRVSGGVKQDGSYRAEVGAVMAPGEDDAGAGTVSDDEFVDMGDGDGGVIEDDAAASGDDELWTEASLTALSVAELKDVVKQYKEAGYDVKASGKKSEVVAAILTAQQEAIDAAASGEGDEEIIADDEEIMEDDSDKLTEEQLKAMEIPQLKEAAAKFSVPTSGKKKSEVIAAILVAQEGGAGGSGGLDDPPF